MTMQKNQEIFREVLVNSITQTYSDDHLTVTELLNQMTKQLKKLVISNVRE